MPTSHIIDIQKTKPGYWILIDTSEDPVNGTPIKSDREETEDGWFVIPYDSLKIKYRFIDDERNTLEAEHSPDGTIVVNYQLKRISSEEEIKMHIVSFKLDDSIESADDYSLSSELIAVESGKSLGEYLPTLKYNDKTVLALFTTADGTGFTEDTLINEDITVTVTPPGVFGTTHYVSTEDELITWANALTNNTSLSCVLLDDITLTEAWVPVGFGMGYAGTFDGRGHSIKGMEIKNSNQSGIFNGIAATGVVKNLTVEVSCNSVDHYNVGTIAKTNNGTIENCHSIIGGSVSLTREFGGIASTNSGSIIGCSSRISGQVSGSANVGGIVGTNNGTITASYMLLEEAGSFSSSDVSCGGIAGNNTDSVTGCYSIINGTISNESGNSYAIAPGGSLTACYWQSSDSFEDNTSGATEVSSPEEWYDGAMNEMNSVIGDTGYKFQKNEGNDAETIPLIIVPSST